MVTAYLSAALQALTGVAPSLTGPYLVCAEPGGEPYLARWDEATLGPKPTDAAIEMAGLAAAQDAACARIEAKRQALIAGGITIDWGDGTKSKVQTRSVADMVNLIGVSARGLSLLTQALTTTQVFRDADDKDHTLLPPQAVAMGATVTDTISAIAAAAHAAKDAINVAKDAAGITAAEAGVVWPGS